MALLEVQDLEIAVASGGKLLSVVRGISFEVEENETLGIVGESGCGKSLTSLAVMGLLEGSQVRITSGSIRFEGKELTTLDLSDRRSIMGDQMAMIFQEPMTSLNPVYRIGDQITEVLRQHRNMTKAQARDRAVELLDLVRIPEPSRRVDSYPHQMSGGQRQRVMIAMALACDPKLLIADEPTTALDVTVQKEVLELMSDLQRRMGTAIVLISHDLGVIAESCDKVAVMYRGKIVEAASTADLFSNMSHPYSRGLCLSLPRDALYRFHLAGTCGDTAPYHNHQRCAYRGYEVHTCSLIRTRWARIGSLLSHRNSPTSWRRDGWLHDPRL